MSAEKQTQSDLASELRKLALMADAGRLPVCAIVYQIERGEKRNGLGIVCRLGGTEDLLYSAMGQTQQLLMMMVQQIPMPDAETFGPEGVDG